MAKCYVSSFTKRMSPLFVFLVVSSLFVYSANAQSPPVIGSSTASEYERAVHKSDKLDPAGNAIFTRADAGLTGTWNGTTSTADIDGDGDVDVLITGRTEDNSRLTTLYVNDGSGQFTEQSTVLPNVGERGSTLFTDVDSDGDSDVILSGLNEAGSPTTQVYLNDGSGTFSEKTDAALPAVRNGDVAATDVDGDGDSDVLVSGYTSSFTALTSLYLNDGTGAFTESTETFSDVWLSEIETGDVNGDGFSDFIVSGRNGKSHTTTVYANDGTGSFTTISSGLTGVSLPGIDLGDIDGDGDLDAVVTGQTASSLISEVFLNDGTGAFSLSQSLTGVYVSAADFADVDNDGDLDLVVSGLGEDGLLFATLQENDGTGTFSTVNAGITGAGDSHQAFADVDGDADLDLFVSGNDPLLGGSSARLYINRTNQDAQNEAPSFARGPSGPTVPVTAETTIQGLFEVGDLDGDIVSISVSQAPSSNYTLTDAGNGTAELEFTVDASQVGQTVSVDVTATDGNGGSATFTVSLEVSDAFVPFGAGITGVFGPAFDEADVNGDGATDLVFAGGDQNSEPLTQLYFGDGAGGFTRQAATGLPNLERGSASLGDVDADGDADLLLTGLNSSGTTQTGLYLNDGAGSFSLSGSANFIDVGFSKGSTLHDVDVDGDLDAIIVGLSERGLSNSVGSVYVNDGTGSFSVGTSTAVPNLSLATSSRVDADDNGVDDLVFVGRAQGGDGPEPTTQLVVAGFGGLTQGPNPPGQIAFGDVAGADFDGDGDEDLVLAGQQFSAEINRGREFVQFYRKQFGLWVDVSTDLLPLRYSAVSAKDIDGDGDPDLMTGGRNDSKYQTYLYRTDPGAFAGYVRFPGIGTGEIAFLDADSDGDNDIVVIGNGQAQVFENRLDPVSATSTKLVSSDQTTTFDDTGARVTFQGTDGSGEVRVDRFEVGPATTLGIDDGASVSNYRFVIDAEESLRFSPTTEIRLDVNTLGGIDNPETVSIFKRDEEGSGAFTQLSTTYDAANNEFVAQVDGFSEFVLASTDPANPLPVEMTQFRAVPDEDEILVEWSTATETANAGFTVEYQAPGSDAFAAAADRDGAGTTTVPQSYSVRLEDVERGLHRFRLRQADVDGTETLSKTIEVMVGPQGAYELEQPYPNPVRHTARMNLSVREAQPVEVVLYNILGQRVAQVHDGRVDPSAPLRLSVDASRLPSGVYFVRVEGEQFQVTRRMTVVR